MSKLNVLKRIEAHCDYYSHKVVVIVVVVVVVVAAAAAIVASPSCRAQQRDWFQSPWGKKEEKPSDVPKF